MTELFCKFVVLKKGKKAPEREVKTYKFRLFERLFTVLVKGYEYRFGVDKKAKKRYNYIVL